MAFFANNATVTSTGWQKGNLEAFHAKQAAEKAQQEETYRSAMASSTAPASPSPGAAQQAKDTYTAEISPETGRATFPAIEVEGKAIKDGTPTNNNSQPTNLQGVGTPPPTEITDVVKDFDWTASINKKQISDKIPFIRLSEFKLTASNVMNGFAAAAMAFADLNRSTMAGAAKVGGVASKVTQGSVLAPAGGLTQTAGDKIASAGTAVEPYRKKAEDYIKSKTNDSFGPEGQHLMDVYGNLYARQATGRIYSLPYFNKSYFDGDNSFDDTASPTVVKGMYDIIDKAGAIPSMFTTGVYVQRPKFYQFASAREPAVNVSLTLYNTLTPMSYMKHAKFIQQLALNNLPRRVTRAIVEPPCIYEVFIPGKAFYPYCFISELRVTNVGTKRMINNEIVPDAFQIEIRLTSLIKDASNLYERQMQHHGLGKSLEGRSSGPAGNLASGGGDNMGNLKKQRDAVADVSAAAATTPSDALANDVAKMTNRANELDQKAASYDKVGNTQKATEMKTQAAQTRAQATTVNNYGGYSSIDEQERAERIARVNASRAATGRKPFGEEPGDRRFYVEGKQVDEKTFLKKGGRAPGTN